MHASEGMSVPCDRRKSSTNRSIRADCRPCVAHWTASGRGDRLVDQLSVHVGEAMVASARAEGEAAVVDAEQMEHRRVQIVDLVRLVYFDLTRMKPKTKLYAFM
ncbi:MAG: hypothetical protein ACO3IB_10720, partial [Phycisphaerales bacterium]